MRALKDNDALEQSSIVANSAMNRERRCTGDNSYAKELGFNPLEFLRDRLASEPVVSWLDLCCGRGRALIEAAEALASEGAAGRVTLWGVDLVPMFEPLPKDCAYLQLLEASVHRWQPDVQFDLITSVHGLHYVGDKLTLLTRACCWLKPDGFFIAHLDRNALKVEGGGSAGLMRHLRRAGLNYDARRRLLSCQGAKELQLDYEYLGADDGVGPNYTGQASVDSNYRLRGKEWRSGQSE